jgi:hypothetical protein
VNGFPEAPTLSDYGRRVLAEVRQRDARLIVETGGTLYDLLAEFAAMDEDERQALLLDGFRWRWFWQPEQVGRRVEREERERRRLAILSSHAISAMCSAPGPSYAELQRRRAEVRPLPQVDPAAVRRWVATGSSKEAAA